MSNSSMFSDFDGLAPIGHARVRPQYGRIYPGRANLRFSVVNRFANGSDASALAETRMNSYTLA